MDRIRIRGGNKLNGNIRISGAKNAALPLMIASLLTDDRLTLKNVPNLADVALLARILRNHGVKSMAPRVFPEKSFPAEYVLKDLGYSLELARSMGVDPQLSALAERYYQAAVEQGYGGRYFPAVIEMIDKGQTP